MREIVCLCVCGGERGREWYFVYHLLDSIVTDLLSNLHLHCFLLLFFLINEWSLKMDSSLLERKKKPAPLIRSIRFFHWCKLHHLSKLDWNIRTNVRISMRLSNTLKSKGLCSLVVVHFKIWDLGNGYYCKRITTIDWLILLRQKLTKC